MSARGLLLALALAAGPTAALAQAPGPANPLGQPREDASEVKPEPAWSGAFAHGDVEVHLRPADGERRFEGTITIGGAPHPARGVVLQDDRSTRLEGGFLSGGREFAFTVTVLGRDELVLVSSGATYSLERVRGPAGATPRAAGERRPEPIPRRREDPASGGAKAEHVKVGQVWVFRLAPRTELRWTITAVTPDAVQYEASTLRDEPEGLRTLVEPMPEEFALDQGTALIGDPDVQRQRVVISGIEFDCLVVDSGGVRTWVPLAGDRPTFPGALRIIKDEVTLRELVRVDAE